jgi:hypothetical protein
MGKKSKFKAIKRLAAQMPEILIHHPLGITKAGHALIHDGVSKLPSGEKVNPMMKYKAVSANPTPLNHSRKMKQLYIKHGSVGISSYLRAVRNYVANTEAAKVFSSEAGAPTDSEGAE